MQDERTFFKDVCRRGKEMDASISADIAATIAENHTSDPFHVVVAESLIWTGHARPLRAYRRKTLRFLKSGDEAALEQVGPFAGRHGAQKLMTALKSWKRILDEHRGMIDCTKCSVPDLAELQMKGLLNTAGRLAEKGEIKGVAPGFIARHSK